LTVHRRGGGVAGITAAVRIFSLVSIRILIPMQQALTNQSITDFLVLEYNDDIGGRLRQTDFGKDPSGKPYTVELGANWVNSSSSFFNK
jgi:polyamine oxidase